MGPHRVVVFKILFLVLIAHQFLFTQLTESSSALSPQETNAQKQSSKTNRRTLSLTRNSSNQDHSDRHPSQLRSENNVPKHHGESESECRSERCRRQAHLSRGMNHLDESAELVADSNGLSDGLQTAATTTRKPNETNEPKVGAQSQTSDTSRQAEINAADLCFLTNGGSSLTLAVNEATPVGAVIGTVDVSVL